MCVRPPRWRGRGKPGAQTARAQTHEYRADELAERGGVNRLQLLLLAVQQVVAVEGAPGQTHALSSLVVIQQPLDLGAQRAVCVAAVSATAFYSGSESHPGQLSVTHPVTVFLGTTVLQH